LDANENPYQTGVNRYPDPQQSNVKAVLAKQRNLQINQILLETVAMKYWTCCSGLLRT
jgi:histidinol-phosphate aminotransferase